jgi:hypothetical protein
MWLFFVRTWTATDACGNTTSLSQTTTFEDTTDPVLVGLPDATSVNCGAVPDGEDFDVTATDNCVNEVNCNIFIFDQGSGCNVIVALLPGPLLMLVEILHPLRAHLHCLILLHLCLQVYLMMQQ